MNDVIDFITQIEVILPVGAFLTGFLLGKNLASFEVIFILFAGIIGYFIMQNF